MHIALQKKSENIAEYLLYMFQVEDVIRGFQFDLDRLILEFVEPQLPEGADIKQYRKWYANLIYEMQSERIEKSGHLLQLQEVLVELSFLHNSLLTVMNDEKYMELFSKALPLIDEFTERSNLKDKNHIEICFHGLYMKLLLRLQNKEITKATDEVFDAMRILVAYLAHAFRQMKNGEGEFWKN